MKDCIFCKIANKEIPAYIIDESENFIAFLDVHPHAPGHTLIIPKKHYQNFKELPEELGNEFFGFVHKIMNLLIKALNTQDATLGVNEGPLSGQAILHFHFHILPRFENDGGGSIHSVVFNKPDESLEEIYKKIKNAS